MKILSEELERTGIIQDQFGWKSLEVKIFSQALERKENSGWKSFEMKIFSQALERKENSGWKSFEMKILSKGLERTENIQDLLGRKVLKFQFLSKGN